MDGRVLQVNVSPGGVPKLPAEARNAVLEWEAGGCAIQCVLVRPGPPAGAKFVTKMSPRGPSTRQNPALGNRFPQENCLQNPICRRRDSNPHGHSPTVFKRSVVGPAAAARCALIPSCPTRIPLL